MAPLPYVGFKPYEQAEVTYFCGRQGEISVLHDTFTEQAAQRGKLLVVYGPSAVGKTSIVQAGLWPVLRLHNEVGDLVRLAPEDGEPLRTFFQRIRHSVGRMSPSDEKQPLVFIDQLEDGLGFPLDGVLEDDIHEVLANLLEFLSQAAHKNIARIVIGIREPWSRFIEDAPRSLEFLQGSLDFFRLNFPSSSGLEEILRTPLFRWKNGAHTGPDQVDNTLYKHYFGELNANPSSLPIANLFLEGLLRDSTQGDKSLAELAEFRTLLNFTVKHVDEAFASWSPEIQAKLPIFFELFRAAAVDASTDGIRSTDARPLIADPDARDVFVRLMEAKVLCLKGSRWQQAEVEVCNDRLFDHWSQTNPNAGHTPAGEQAEDERS